MNKGYTALELLFAFLVFGICLLVLIPFQKTLIRLIQLDQSTKTMQNMRIQFILAQSKIISVEQDRIYLQYQQEQTIIQIEKNRIVKKPGYHILRNNVDGIFFIENNCIYLNEEKLYCEKGIH